MLTRTRNVVLLALFLTALTGCTGTGGKQLPTIDPNDQQAWDKAWEGMRSGDVRRYRDAHGTEYTLDMGEITVTDIPLQPPTAQEQRFIDCVDRQTWSSFEEYRDRVDPLCGREAGYSW